MNLIDLVLDKKNKGTLSQIAKQFNISDDTAKGAMGELIPALQRGMKKNTSNIRGLDELLAAIEGGKHGSYLNKPKILNKKETQKDGDAILGHIFGNKKVSRRVAKRAAKKSGLGEGLMKKLLPIVATVVMGSLGKKLLTGKDSGSGSRRLRKKSPSLITSILDSDKDGAVLDDLLGYAVKALK